MSESTHRDTPPIGPADIDFRPMRPADIDRGLQLCRLAGWDQVRRDWERFICDPDTKVSVATHSGGARTSGGGDGSVDQIVATVATVCHAEFGWIGMLLVHPDLQGRGGGAVVLGHATADLAGVPSVRLAATPAGRFLYLKHGFHDEAPLKRMEATAPVVDGSLESSVQRLGHPELADVVALDRQAFGVARGDLLAWMLDGAPEYGFVARHGGRTAGFVLGRHGHAFEHVGPIVAADSSVAMALVRTCLAANPGRAFIIDSANESHDWCTFLERTGFREQRPYIRMYRGAKPEFGIRAHQFAILGPEFG